MSMNNGKEAKPSPNTERAKNGENSRKKEEPAPSTRGKVRETKERMKNCETVFRTSKAKTSLPHLPRSKSLVREGETTKDVPNEDSGKRLNKFCKHASDAKRKGKLPNIVGRNSKSDTWQKNAEIEAMNTELLDSVDSMSANDLEEALRRIRDNPVEPLTFLANVLDNPKPEDHFPAGSPTSTEIDMKLLSLMRRIELNKTLLERTKQRVEDIKFLSDRNKTLPAAHPFQDMENIPAVQVTTDVQLDRSDLRPRIEQLRQTMKLTIDMLQYVRKISKGDIQLHDLPQDLLNHMKINDIKSTGRSEH